MRTCGRIGPSRRWNRPWLLSNAIGLALLSALVGARAAGEGTEAAAPAAVSEAARSAASGILGRRLAAHVQFLASDHMEGRESGTRGERLAAEYLRAFHTGLGLSPAGPEGSFFQEFDLHEKSLGPGNAFRVVRRGPDGSELRTSYPLGDGFVPFNFSPSGSVEGPVVFAGYGIEAPERGYEDYASVDVRGAIVLILRHEPREADPDSSFNGLRMTRHASFLEKARLAQRKGAAGLLVVTDPVNHTPEAQRPANAVARWHTLHERDEFDTRPRPDPYQFYPGFAADVRIPALHVSPAAAADLLAGLGQDLAALQRAIDEKLKPASRKLPGVRASISTDIAVKRVPARNVIARLEGRDPDLEDEVVVLGAHYDHVGYGHFSSATGHWGAIHPGADDNASGTACLLSIAEALSRAPSRPRRSVLFVHFTAEEKGLFGSRWFTDHPTVPLERIVAMINLDMAGRNEPHKVSSTLDDRARGLDAMLKRIGQGELHLTMDNDVSSWTDRSDQWSFSRRGIPSAAITSGSHEDYHRPSDRADRVVPDKLQNIARLTAMAAWEIAEGGAEAIRAPEGE